MIALFSSLFTYGFVIAIASVGGVLAFIVSYLLPAIALFNMANKAGHPYPWLAFIPFAQTYLEFTLPKNKRFKVFFVDTDQRSLMAVITLIAANFGTGIIAGLNLIPVLGQLLDVALAVFLAAFNWRKMRDLHLTFGADEEKATIIALIGIFVPVVYSIFLLLEMNNEPDYGFGNFQTKDTDGEYAEINEEAITE
ncbi:MAG: hypothetical protein J6X80_00255 [Lachnospiraceae bacterium]|nr:hypothetical protein [Lachnospiraceae bacterium]